MRLEGGIAASVQRFALAQNTKRVLDEITVRCRAAYS